MNDLFECDVAAIKAHFNKCDWLARSFDMRKAAIASIFSKWAYWACQHNEVERRGRFKIFPCSSLYQYNFVAPPITMDDIRLALSEVGEGRADADFVEGEYASASIVRVENVIFVAVRGTSALYESSKRYDWFFVNLRFHKIEITPSVRVHAGYWDAASAFLSAISRKISDMAKGRPRVQVYVTGHSLGGAVGCLLYELLPINDLSSQRNAFYGCHSWDEQIQCSNPPSWELNSAYVFGAPRYANQSAMRRGLAPYSIIHSKDPVPKILPRMLGFADPKFRLSFSAECSASSAKQHVDRSWLHRSKILAPYHDVDGYCFFTSCLAYASDGRCFLSN